MKRVLMLASVPSMIGQFNMSNIQILQELGYEVHVACNWEDRSVWTEKRVSQFQEELRQKKIAFFQSDISRSVSQIGSHIRAYRQIRDLCRKNSYCFIHCHTPLGGVIGRVVGNRTHTKVIYTAHGFHFFEGAPKKNWIFYYPVEWICSWMTEVLITINQEDYQRAQKHFHAKKIYYVPGVGVDTKRIAEISVNRENKRAELGIRKNTVVLVSVGELNKNKNHMAVIQALGQMKEKNQICYVICGKGEQRKRLIQEAENYGVDLKLPGFRQDIIEILKAADIFVFPSKREGCPVALIEAMACGLPCLASDIRGNRELIDGKFLVLQWKDHIFPDMLRKVLEEDSLRERIGEQNRGKSYSYDKQKVNVRMKSIYKDAEKKSKRGSQGEE